MARVGVLLSTFNGEKYLQQLLDSLAAQSYPEIAIRIRDDGSADGTWEILSRWARQRADVELTRGPNRGPADSFLELLRDVPPSLEYVAFCDQDDVWDPDKIAWGVEVLAGCPPTPTLYFSRLRITDENLDVLRLSPLPSRPPGLRNALAQNIVTGCASLMNRAAIDVLQATLPPPLNVRMHDWWSYQVLSAVGEIVYDPQPHIHYRQHGANVVGHPGLLGKWRSRLARTRTRRGQLLRHARLLRDRLGVRLPSTSRTLVQEFITALETAGTIARLRYAARMPVYRQTALDTLVLRLLMVLRMT